MKSRSTNLPGAIVLPICILMVAAVMLPRIVTLRTAARADGCVNNLKQVGLAIHNYHSAYKRLPVLCGGTTGSESEAKGNQGWLSPMVGLLPFIEQQRLWEVISNRYSNPTSGESFPPMGPVPWYDSQVYQPWGQAPSVYQCPDATGGEKPPEMPEVMETLKPWSGGGVGLISNYVVSVGDAVDRIGQPVGTDAEALRRQRASARGMFIPGREMKFRDMLDGLSNTIMMSETLASEQAQPGTRIAKDVAGLIDSPALCLSAGQKPGVEFWEFGRGSRWCDGRLPMACFQTILPPNSPSCTTDNGILEGVMSASSRHPGGVHTLFGDGAVIFLSDSIDAGDPTKPSVHLQGSGRNAPGSASPYGLWGSLGTRANREVVQQQYGTGGSPRRGSSGGSRGASRETVGMSRWRDKGGTVNLMAVFVRVIDRETVELKDAFGILHRVPLNSLSDKDIFRAVEMDLDRR